MNFFKYQGSGNDFILIEDKNMEPLVPDLCNRHFGIGADGVILLKESLVADVKMRIFNADGSEADMCGNALRCITLHMGKESLSIETRAGICFGKIEDGKISSTLPFAKEISEPLLLADGRLGYYVDTGVPHLIVFEENLMTSNFEKGARELRFDKRLGEEGANVSYIKNDRENIFIRTYERGVEKETLSCGTGSAAAVFIVRKHDKKERSSYTVHPISKQVLKFTFDKEGRMWMQGPAGLVFEGMTKMLLSNDKRECVL